MQKVDMATIEMQLLERSLNHTYMQSQGLSEILSAKQGVGGYAAHLLLVPRFEGLHASSIIASRASCRTAIVLVAMIGNCKRLLTCLIGGASGA